jgi:hydroxymethylpyrimidine pyrophosphatase-like HAD family hydrolase
VRFRVLAVDYDGTLAIHGEVSDATVAALERVRESGRKLVLVTGRVLDDLRTRFPHLDVFDRIVAENGATLFDPTSGDERVFADPPADQFLETLRQRGVPVGTGRVVVASNEPHETTILEVIRDLGLELQVIFNKGAVMVLPVSVNKASGLRAALDALGLSSHNAIGIGDAENDHAFLDLCECAVAVSNALRSVKRQADIVTKAAHGDGVVEVIEQLLADDLASLEPRLKRHRILLGSLARSQKPIGLPPVGTRMLVAGASKAGKSSFLLGLVEQVHARGYQYCLIDPEGDFERLPDTVTLGDPDQSPSTDDVIEVLRTPGHNVCVSLLAVSGEHRPGYFSRLLAALESLALENGRPHWLIVDEAHHVLPREVMERGVSALASVVLVTLDPARVSSLALAESNRVLALGRAPRRALAGFAELIGANAPAAPSGVLRKGEGVLWQPGKKRAHVVELVRSSLTRRRHRRKYTEGELPPERSFYFRGPTGDLNLRAANLHEFVRLGDGVDDATWEFHLSRGDYAQWVEFSLKDRKLARDIARLASVRDARQSRAEVRALIEKRYAPPA